MKYSRLLYIVHLPIFFFLTTNLCIADTSPAMLPATAVPQFRVQRNPEEGFAAGTLVHVPDGYKCIEDIHIHDIVLDDHAQTNRVLKVVKRIADRSVHVKIDGQNICMGYEQAVRLPYTMQWCLVSDVQEKEYLLSADGRMLCVDQHALVPEVTVLYQLSVEDHIFCVGPTNIIVHNADVATVSAAMLCLEYVAYAHPVVALVGCTIALSTIARKAYEVWRQSRQPTDMDDDIDEIAQEVFLAERYYYEQRKKELTTLRDEFTGIHRGITAMKELFHPQIATFSSQFLQHTVQQHTTSNMLRISIADELKLSDDRKTALRNAREQEFALLEKEISELHATLVVHFNELMRQVNEAHDAYYKALPTINQAINVWNVNLASTTDSIASATYEQNIREECLLNTIKQATAEFKVIVAYYQRNKQLACLEQSTDIIERLDGLHQAIIETEQWIPQELARVSANQRGNEHYFARRGIPTPGFKNQIKNAFYKEQNNKNAQSLKKAKEAQEDMCATGGPNDPKKPKDDEDKDDEKVKTADMPENEGILGHIFRNEEGHLHRTPENYKLIRDLVRDAKNYLGPDIRGNHWWGKILENGKQLWAQAYKGIVRNGGMNDVPRPYNAKTGLSKLI